MIPRPKIELSRIAIWLMVAVVAGNGIVLYRKTAQRKQVAAVRRELAAHAARIDPTRVAAALEDPWRLKTVLADMQRSSENGIAWMQLRDENGAIAARAGAPAEYSLTESALPRLRQGHAIYRVVETRAGSAVVEAFLVRLPHGIEQGGGSYAVIELAARIKRSVTNSIVLTSSPKG